MKKYVVEYCLTENQEKKLQLIATKLNKEPEECFQFLMSLNSVKIITDKLDEFGVFYSVDE